MTFMFLFLGILMLFSGGSIMSIWFSFSFSLLATMMFMENKKSDLSLKYVFVQEMSTWATLFSLLFNNSFFISLSLMMKLGLPPFHWWFQELVMKNPSFSSWLLGPSKLIPGFAFIFFFSQKFLILMFFSLLFSLLLLGGGSSFYPTLIFSSSFNTLLFFCYSSTSFYSSFFYFFLYSIFLFFFLYLSEGKKDSSWEVMLVISGLPPGFIFFLKVLVLFSSGEWFSFYLFLVLFSTIPLFFSYLQLWEKNISNSSIFFLVSQQNLLTGHHVLFMLLVFFFIFSF